jgi:hypothetical protein
MGTYVEPYHGLLFPMCSHEVNILENNIGNMLGLMGNMLIGFNGNPWDIFILYYWYPDDIVSDCFALKLGGAVCISSVQKKKSKLGDFFMISSSW